MKAILSHDREGSINTVAFLGKGAEDLEMEAPEGESVLTMDSRELPDPPDPDLGGERLSDYGFKLREAYEVRDGRLVRRTR